VSRGLAADAVIAGAARAKADPRELPEGGVQPEQLAGLGPGAVEHHEVTWALGGGDRGEVAGLWAREEEARARREGEGTEERPIGSSGDLDAAVRETQPHEARRPEGVEALPRVLEHDHAGAIGDGREPGADAEARGLPAAVALGSGLGHHVGHPEA